MEAMVVEMSRIVDGVEALVAGQQEIIAGIDEVVEEQRSLGFGVEVLQRKCKGNWKLDLAKLAGGPKINIL